MDFLGDLAGFEADFNQIYYIYSRFGIELLGFPWCLVSIESLETTILVKIYKRNI